MPTPIDASERHVVRLERLLAAGRALTAELDLQTMLDRLLVAGRDLTGARYAALGVLDEARTGLAEFLTLGLDEETRETIGDLPRGHGILGLLIDRPTPIRLHDISQHPRSYGFPPGHPPMRSFLGAPITVHGRIWGNLYLSEKRTGEDFDDDDVDSIVTLAQWAGIAIDNARLFAESARGRAEVEQTMRTTIEIAEAIGSDTGLPPILELIARRARELVDAHGLLIWLREGDELRIAAVAGDEEVPSAASIPVDGSTAGEALRTGRPVRVADARSLRADPAEFGMDGARSALVVPLTHRGQGLGVLVAFDRRGTSTTFGADHERTLAAFAASASTAVATARLVERQRLQDTMAAAEAERTRWARELHDQTLQGLASLKILLGGALRAPSGTGRPAVESAVGQVEHEIEALRAIIADLRPAALDELGLEPALRTLVARLTGGTGVRARVDIDLGRARLPPEVETTAYRVAQEAVTNVLKHAGASSVELVVRQDADRFLLRVVDDGRGPGGGGAAPGAGGDRRPEAPVGSGFGVVGMLERAALAGGVTTIGPGSGGGTVVALDLPLRPPGAGADG
ncbi:GAF domain-containing sensor histidine kinase [Patulibacter sp.]|uniref:GAF domain-containing sensor histidine kinase n=1 Tax=Patulibacter sp. TaxID=1912859 RepID=UPI00271D682A|nr:GAF domain-containing sensor histidine kinase [Patulibacter sp.]MDO9410880.1 GAF domain-containing sensor histidine kinase [Patulibacter sp.]